MFHMPMSSPMMTTMFGRWPVGAWACAVWIGVALPTAETAASVVLPSRMLRRFGLLLGLSSRVVCVELFSGVFTVFSLVVFSSLSLGTQDAAKADVARRRVDRLRVPSGRAITAAVVRRTQMRAALEHLAGNANVGLTGIVARRFRSAPRVFRDAARLRCVSLVLCGPPIRGPLPHVADHVVDAVAVRRECRHRGRARVTIRFEILVWEGSLPGVRHVSVARREFVPPGEFGGVEPTRS